MADQPKNTQFDLVETEGTASLKYFFTPQPGPVEAQRTTSPLKRKTWDCPEVIDALRAELGEGIGEVVQYAGENTVFIDSGSLIGAARFLKDKQGFDYFCDLGAIDRFEEENRFEVAYNLVALEGKKRIRLKVVVGEDDPVVPSIVDVWPAANWHEREVFDMMGIRFEGHPDLRRMFMPEDFEYYPARKEFPTLGIPGSLPLPAQENGGDLTPDPFARAHGQIPKD